MADRAAVTDMEPDLFTASGHVRQFNLAEPITKLMYIIWSSRPDLQSVFDITSSEGQAAFSDWARHSIPREYGLGPFGDVDRGSAIGTNSGKNGASLFTRFKSLFGAGRRVSNAPHGVPGATLIGYAEGILGMGEHVRMSAEALSATAVPFGVFDVDSNGRGALASQFPSTRQPRYRANIFHVNADQMLATYCKLGPGFFQHRYNIGFWAWELSRWPKPWHAMFDLVDEIWAPSRFIRDCLFDATDKPVEHIPLCVELPRFKKLPRARFGLPTDDCLFLFAFDFRSYIERKNPVAAIRAFKKAFPSRHQRAGLVIKVMNAERQSEKWQELLLEIQDDPRIYVINEVMSRAELLALMETCDCFVSLHRSEGFGRGPAEALYLGKPVIVTNYSGNTDFTRPDTSLLVDYELRPVGTGEYVHGEDQSWADADIDHAAEHMRRVQEERPEIAKIATQGQKVIRSEFSSIAVGRSIERRLEGLGLLQQ